MCDLFVEKFTEKVIEKLQNRRGRVIYVGHGTDSNGENPYCEVYASLKECLDAIARMSEFEEFTYESEDSSSESEDNTEDSSSELEDKKYYEIYQDLMAKAKDALHSPGTFTLQNNSNNGYEWTYERRILGE